MFIFKNKGFCTIPKGGPKEKPIVWVTWAVRHCGTRDSAKMQRGSKQEMVPK